MKTLPVAKAAPSGALKSADVPRPLAEPDRMPRPPPAITDAMAEMVFCVGDAGAAAGLDVAVDERVACCVGVGVALSCLATRTRHQSVKKTGPGTATVVWHTAAACGR